jgi:anti-anti-sigma factor
MIRSSCIVRRISASDPPIDRGAAASPGELSGHLRIERVEQPGTVVLSLSGELDLESAPALASVLREPENTDAARIVLDLSALEFIDSTGISVLVQSRLQAGEAGRHFVLTNLPSNVDRLFSITGITSQFTII